MLRNKRLQRVSSRAAIVGIVFIQILFTPLTRFGLGQAYAQEADPTVSPPAAESVPPPAQTGPATPETTGPTSPPGPDGKTYTYNAQTGLWENDYYTWDPVTKQTKPKQTPNYSFNPCTGRWDTTEWYYDAAAGKYVSNTPGSGNTCGGTVAAPAPPPAASARAAQDTAQQPALAGPGDNASITLENTNTGAFDLYFNADISHNIYLGSASGDVYLTGNTTAGNGTSGNATGMANIINMLQSAWGIGGADIDLFNMDIHGDVFGDFFIDPMRMFGTLDSVDNTTNNNIDINVGNTAAMQNDINVNAQSGNVTGSSNTTVGNLTSGTANAVANVVNMINSAITAGNSFIGTINIYGNFDGDILMPEEAIQALLASNEIPKTTINASQIQNNQAVVNMTNDQAITNNVNANATSGNATLTGNTNAGSATSGNGNTNITVLNLTGQQVVGSNALLVFVNVLGSWVGMIVNAPAGATAAALGSGDTVQNTSINNTLEADIDNDFTIENNINLNAQSGNVTGQHNTTVGNATSGDATASANIANFSNSNFSLGGWFWALFINVFGKWNGSVGIDTAAGERPFVPPATPGTAETSIPTLPFAVFSFTPSGGPVATSGAASQAIQSAIQEEENKSAILASSLDNGGSDGPSVLQAAFNWASLAPVIFLILLAIGATESIVYLFSRRNNVSTV